MKHAAACRPALVATVAVLNGPVLAAAGDLAPIRAKIAAQHDANVERLREWIALPSIAAEDLGYPAGPEYQAQLLREAGFQHVEIIPTDGKPGVFAPLDAGAAKTVGV